jgi:hypothetical protein
LASSQLSASRRRPGCARGRVSPGQLTHTTSGGQTHAGADGGGDAELVGPGICLVRKRSATCGVQRVDPRPVALDEPDGGRASCVSQNWEQRSARGGAGEAED